MKISPFTAELMAASCYKPETVKELIRSADFDELRIARGQLYMYMRDVDPEDSDWAQMLVDLVYEEIRNRKHPEPTMRVLTMDEDGKIEESQQTVEEIHKTLFDLLGE